MSKALGTCDQLPLPKSTPSQLLLCVQQQIGKTKEEGRRPHKVGFHGVTGTQSSILSKRGEGPRGGPGSWRVEHCAESQGQPLTAWVGERRGLRSSPPALAQLGCIPTLACVHPSVNPST